MGWTTRPLRTCALAALVMGAVAPAPAGAQAQSPPTTLVVGLDVPSAAAELGSLPGVDVLDAQPAIGAAVVEVGDGRLGDALDALAEAPGVRFVEAEQRYSVARTPADTYWSYQWGARKVRAPEAWEATTGSPSTTIAVLDTGVDPGPDLDEKLLPGVDLVNDDADPGDDHGHGTSVAVIAAGDADDGGVAGICWTCRVLPVKVLGADGSGSSYDIAQGISWATEHGADVIVMSLGGPDSTRVVDDAVAGARAAGVVVVAAAGNAGGTTPNYPAASPGVIGVAGSDPVDLRYSWSNHGSWVDIAAPGCNGAPFASGGYGDFCGTSSAAPVAAGAAALGMSLGATRAEVEQALVGTAVPVGTWVGGGRLDVAAMTSALAQTVGNRTGGGGADPGAGSDPLVPDPDLPDPDLPDPDPRPVPLTVTRVAGQDRVATSVALATRAYPSGAGTVVIARADVYADALAAAPLAASAGAPVLLTGADGLRADVARAVHDLGASDAVLIGGHGALSTQVERDLTAAGVSAVRRIAGTNRFDTARLIAEELGGTSAYVVEGANASEDRGWPDAVALSGLAAMQRRPILLTTRDMVPPETQTALRSLQAGEVTVIGGTAAVSTGAEAVLAALGSVRRIAGATRYDTSAQLAAAAVAAGADGDQVWVATGRSWPDALAAGASTGALGVVLVLVDGSDLDRSPESARFLESRPSLREVVLVGGTGSISTTVADAVGALRPAAL